MEFPRSVAAHHVSASAVGLHGVARKEHQMLDLVLLALGLGFFVLTIGYAYACDRL
jgi:hypothetical protein